MTDKPTGKEVALAGQEPSLLNIIAKAMDKPDFDIDKMERLLAAQDKIKADEAKQAYIAAMMKFHESAPSIVKTKQIYGKENNKGVRPALYKVADFDYTIKIVRPALLAVNIIATWSTEAGSNPGWVSVTCILSHKDGHSERSTLEGPPDASGGKNPIQGVGSSDSYLRRYTLMSAAGLVAEGEDTDGLPEAREQTYITDAEAEELKVMMKKHNVTESDFLKLTKMEKVTDLLERDYRRAEELIVKRGEVNARNS